MTAGKGMTAEERALWNIILKLQQSALRANQPAAVLLPLDDGWIKIKVFPVAGQPQVAYLDSDGCSSDRMLASRN